MLHVLTGTNHQLFGFTDVQQQDRRLLIQLRACYHASSSTLKALIVIIDRQRDLPSAVSPVIPSRFRLTAL